ncbi:symmetrical bis(5'-nucleosyl)-tetraphosphatase [uncultured Paraglaciecola sp.]|uniref:symmetrical bis(5'-nucleosyl)-tetraphosphatase n=1 Tax=uncultured Paraglaciecola sp. TaxID=1765024 RepID=UPI00262A203A|nr:symmetrical bis(5'-nucleosyl)-tetraphosphatase [uncultured Paraglaciecola sp.]
MATYIVGDIQGCLSGLKRLLKKVAFTAKKDRLIAVGDLIGRGPQPLDTLNYLHSLGSSFDTVLGNHDLHLLAIYAGIRQAKSSDKLDTLIDSPKFKSHISWLRTKPLALMANPDTLITHAGLYPLWSVKKALKLSQEVSDQLQAKDWKVFLSEMYGNQPSIWHKSLSGTTRLRFIVNAMTRMRYIENQDALDFQCKAPPELAPEGLTPWFNVTNKKLKASQKVVFGHWAALHGNTHNQQFCGLDTGYVWGNSMTLMDISTGKQQSIPYKD